MQHRTETSVEPNGTIVLRGLPFHEGDKVIVTITTSSKTTPQNNDYPLRGLPVEYKKPFEPVAEDDWRLDDTGIVVSRNRFAGTQPRNCD